MGGRWAGGAAAHEAALKFFGARFHLAASAMSGLLHATRPPPSQGRKPINRKLVWVLLVVVVILISLLDLITGGHKKLDGIISTNYRHDLQPFPGQYFKPGEMDVVSAEFVSLMRDIDSSMEASGIAEVQNRLLTRQEQQWAEFARPKKEGGLLQQALEQRKPRSEKPIGKPVQPAVNPIPIQKAEASFKQPVTRQHSPMPQPEAKAGQFSGVSVEELEAEKSRFAAAVEEYRGGELKRLKATLGFYRQALHKYTTAREMRRRPYPPEPKAPVVKLAEMPETHSLAAKCYAAGKEKQPKKPRVTLMSQHAYRVGDNVVTWVRTVGAVSQEFWDVLPAEDPLGGVKFGTCAVVGSAGLLRTRRFGPQIDAHDAVFRFNSAYTTGLEEYVGSRTTIRLMNRENFGFEGGPEEIVLQHITTLDMMGDFAAYRRLRPSTKLYAIHPAFYERVITPDAEHPSNGYFGMRLALEMCGCVRLYGFIRTWQGYMTYHYHDDYTPRKSQHSRDSSELPLIRGLLNEHLGRMAFSHPCILTSACEGCPRKAARCEPDVPYPVPTKGHCYGHGPPGGHPPLNPWEPGKFLPNGMPDQGGRLARAREVYKPAASNMNDQKPFLPYADERRACFRECLEGDQCPGGPGGICPSATAGSRACLPWRDVSSALQGLS